MVSPLAGHADLRRGRSFAAAPARYLWQTGSCAHLIRNRISAKAGTPIRAVTTPTGISCGANAVRAIASTHTMKIAPISAVAGSSRLCLVPTRNRAACGSTSPTKPIAPAALTRVAVIKRGDGEQGAAGSSAPRYQATQQQLLPKVKASSAGALVEAHQYADDHHRAAQQDIRPAGSRQRTEQPERARRGSVRRRRRKSR